MATSSQSGIGRVKLVCNILELAYRRRCSSKETILLDHHHHSPTSKQFSARYLTQKPITVDCSLAPSITTIRHARRHLAKKCVAWERERWLNRVLLPTPCSSSYWSFNCGKPPGKNGQSSRSGGYRYSHYGPKETHASLQGKMIETDYLKRSSPTNWSVLLFFIIIGDLLLTTLR